MSDEADDPGILQPHKWAEMQRGFKGMLQRYLADRSPRNRDAVVSTLRHLRLKEGILASPTADETDAWMNQVDDSYHDQSAVLRLPLGAGKVLVYDRPTHMDWIEPGP